MTVEEPRWVEPGIENAFGDRLDACVDGVAGREREHSARGCPVARTHATILANNVPRVLDTPGTGCQSGCLMLQWFRARARAMAQIISILPMPLERWAEATRTASTRHRRLPIRPK